MIKLMIQLVYGLMIFESPESISYQDIIGVQVLPLDDNHISVLFTKDGSFFRSMRDGCKILKLPSNDGMDEIGFFMYQVNSEAVPTRISFESRKFTNSHRRSIKFWKHLKNKK